MKVKRIRIQKIRLSVFTLRKMILLVCGLLSVQVIYAEYCPYSTAAFGGSKGPCIDDDKGKNSANSQANTQAVIGAVSAIAGVWETQRNERIKRQEQENAQRRTEFNRAVADAENNADTNPWANSTSDKKDKKQDKKHGDINLGNCVEQNFSMRSDGQFALKNSCNYAINLKYIFSSSKPFSGTYSTLQPNQVTFETGKQDETVKFKMCPVPKIPQSLDGGGI